MRNSALPTLRPAAVAGMFYSDNGDALRAQVQSYIAEGVESNLVPKAIVAPHAGYQYSGAVAGSAYRQLKKLPVPVERVYLFGPTHRVYTKGVAGVSVDGLQTPFGNVPVDKQVLSTLMEQFPYLGISDHAHEQEHSLEVHLPFLVAVLGDFAVVFP